MESKSQFCPYCKYYERCNLEYKEPSGYCDKYKDRDTIMTTQQELKDQCTPEFVKWMCELAEGFSDHDVNMFEYRNDFEVYFAFKNGLMCDTLFFCTLLHRAVEGWNKSNICRPIQILVNCVMWITDKDNPASIEYGYEDYQPQSLTQAECAMLDCLIDIFKEER